jgi:hypothetical protein
VDGELLAATFVELTDTMVAGFDLIEFLHVLTNRSVQLLDVSAAGLLLADPRGELRLAAASCEAARLLELFQLQNDEGPCLEATAGRAEQPGCHRAGQGQTRGASRPGHGPGLHPPARQRPRPQPAPVRSGRGLRRGNRTPYRTGQAHCTAATPHPGTGTPPGRKPRAGLLAVAGRESGNFRRSGRKYKIILPAMLFTKN